MFYNFFSYLNHKRDGPRVRLHVPYPMYVTLTFSLIASIAYILSSKDQVAGSVVMTFLSSGENTDFLLHF